jgi:putative tricarboxylic transport membrane protein
MIMFASIYSAAFFGGAVTAILLAIPGEAAAVVTIFDGYQLAKKGRAGAALGMAAFASVIGGFFGTMCFMIFAPLLAKVALNFGPAEFFTLVFFSLTFISLISGDSVLKGIISSLLGLMLPVIGIDIISGQERFTLGLSLLEGGIGIPVVIIGVFAVSEMFNTIEESIGGESMLYKGKIRFRDVFPTKEDWKNSIGALWRGSVIGTIIGALPGAGATIASFVSYYVEKRVSKHPEKFGTGVIEGVAGPECANNSVCAGAMIPAFTLGVPGSNTTAVMIGALLLHGLRPGPNLFIEHHDIVWGIIGGMYIGNIMALIIGLTCNNLFVKTLKLPFAMLVGLILPLCVIGIYTMDNSTDALWLILIFGIIGYFMKKFEFPTSTFVLSFVLGSLMENSLRQSLTIFSGKVTGFFESPIATGFLVATLLGIIFTAIKPVIKLMKNK